MIYIFDNKQSYSAHEIYFIGASADVPEHVVLAIMRSGGAEGRVVACAEKFDWRDGGSTQPLAEFLQRNMLVEDLTDEEAAKGKPFPWKILADAVPKSLIKEAIGDWLKPFCEIDPKSYTRWYTHEALKIKQIAKRYGLSRMVEKVLP